MELVTGYANKAHVTAQQIAEFQEAITGSGDYVLNTGSKLSATLLSNNKIRLSDGGLCMQGRHAVIAKNQNEEVTIENGTQGQKRIDLIVGRYVKDTTTGIETVKIYAIKGISTTGTPVVPRAVIGDIRAGDTKHEMPLYTVELNGVNIIKVESIFEICVTNKDLSHRQDSLNSDLNGMKCVEIGRAAIVGAGNIFDLSTLLKNGSLLIVKLGVGAYNSNATTAVIDISDPTSFNVTSFWNTTSFAALAFSWTPSTKILKVIAVEKGSNWAATHLYLTFFGAV